MLVEIDEDPSSASVYREDSVEGGNELSWSILLPRTHTTYAQPTRLLTTVRREELVPENPGRSLSSTR